MIKYKLHLTMAVVIDPDSRISMQRLVSFAQYSTPIRRQRMAEDKADLRECIQACAGIDVPADAMDKVYTRLVDVATLLHWRAEIECSFSMPNAAALRWWAEEKRLLANLKRYIKRYVPGLVVRFDVCYDPRGCPLTLVIASSHTNEPKRFAVMRKLHNIPAIGKRQYEEEWLEN